MRTNFHLSNLVQNGAEKYGERAALLYKEHDNGPWIELSWNRMYQETHQLSLALIQLGVCEHDTIGIFSQNLYQAIVCDFAAIGIHATVVPLYATSTASQIEYIAQDAEIKWLFVGEQYQYDTACEAAVHLPQLKRVIALDKAVVLQDKVPSVFYDDLLQTNAHTHENELNIRLSHCGEEDLISILYTSGTTGNPKGVTLHQYNYTEALRIHEERLAITTDKDTSIAFLPLTHVFERTWDYFCLEHGVTIYINHLPANIQQTVAEVKPTLMCSVPRYWEKVYAAINAKIESTPAIMRLFFRWAISIGHKYNLKYKRLGKHAPTILSLRYKCFARPLFKVVKKLIGIERGKYFPTAGARLSDEINEFLHAIGINICYGYGLTESTATVCCYLPENREYIIGSIGRIMPSVEVKISNEGEILLKGKTITAGYYKRDEANKESFTEDGWFRTGDAGYIDMSHNLYLTDRIKDLFKTAGGKYIAPQNIEGMLINDKYIEQAAVIGNEHKYVTALIVPNFAQLKAYAYEHKLSYNDSTDLLDLPQIAELFNERIALYNSKLARYEQIKKFTLLSKPFTMEQGHLTNTLKLKRAVINKLFAKEIALMYPDE